MKHPDFPRIVIDFDVCGGRPVIEGTRMRVSDILAMLSKGANEKEIMADFPYIKLEDIRACLAYAAQFSDHSVIAAE